jgi:hypothetical protein
MKKLNNKLFIFILASIISCNYQKSREVSQPLIKKDVTKNKVDGVVVPLTPNNATFKKGDTKCDPIKSTNCLMTDKGHKEAPKDNISLITALISATSQTVVQVAALFNSSNFEDFALQFDSVELAKLKSVLYRLGIHYESASDIVFIASPIIPVTDDNMEFAFQMEK